MIDYSVTIEIFLDAKQKPQAGADLELEKVIQEYTNLDATHIAFVVQNIMNNELESLPPRHLDLGHTFKDAVNRIGGFEARLYRWYGDNYEIPYLVHNGKLLLDSLYESGGYLKTCQEVEELLPTSQLIVNELLNPDQWIDDDKKLQLWTEKYKPYFEGRYRLFYATQWLSQSKLSYIIIYTLP